MEAPARTIDVPIYKMSTTRPIFRDRCDKLYALCVQVTYVALRDAEDYIPNT